MRFTGNQYAYLAVIALSLFVVFWALFGEERTLEASLLPVVFGGLAFSLAAAGLAKEILAIHMKDDLASENKKGGDDDIAGEPWRGYIINFAWVAGFVVEIYILGLIVGTALFVLTYMRYLGTKWRIAIPSAAVGSAAIYGAFQVALQIDLYRGLFFEWLGY